MGGSFPGSFRTFHQCKSVHKGFISLRLYHVRMESTQSLQASIHKGTKSIYKERKVLMILMNLGLGT